MSILILTIFGDWFLICKTMNLNSKPAKLLRLSFLVLLTLIIHGQMMAQSTDQKGEVEPFVVAAYYMPHRGVSPDQLPLDKLTHIIYSFSRVRFTIHVS